jgi:hypothetical protein
MEVYNCVSRARVIMYLLDVTCYFMNKINFELLLLAHVRFCCVVEQPTIVFFRVFCVFAEIRVYRARNVLNTWRNTCENIPVGATYLHFLACCSCVMSVVPSSSARPSKGNLAASTAKSVESSRADPALLV